MTPRMYEIDRRRARTQRIVLYVAILALALFFLLPHESQAGTLTHNWTNATTDVEGKPIPATGPGAIKETLLEFGPCGTGSTAAAPVWGTKAGEKIVAMPALTTTTTHADGAVVCVRAQSVNNGGWRSGWSNVTQKTAPTAAPNPPVLTTLANVAWLHDTETNNLRLVGFVPLGAACDSTVTVQRFGVKLNGVPAAAIKDFAGQPVPAGRYVGVCSTS